MAAGMVFASGTCLCGVRATAQDVCAFNKTGA